MVDTDGPVTLHNRPSPDEKKRQYIPKKLKTHLNEGQQWKKKREQILNFLGLGPLVVHNNLYETSL